MSEIPNSWLRTRLGEITDYGKVDRIESRDIPDDAWVLALADIEKDTSRLLERVTFAQRQSKSTKNRFRKGEVLYGKLRPYLNKVLMADDDGFCTTEIVPISSSNAIIGRYLFYWLRTPEFLAYVNAVSYGLNMPRLGTKDGLAAPAILAPITEQKRIADKLDSLLQKVDTCQEHLERVPQIIKRFRQSVLAEAVSGRLTEEWRGENSSGEMEIENFSFPDTWQIQSFDDTLDLIDGDRGKNYPKRTDYQESGYCVFLSTKNVRDFGFKFEEVVFISEEKHNILRSGTLERGDVVITTRGTLGNVAYYDDTVPFDVIRINSGMLILRKKQENILGKYLVICIASSFFKTQLEEKRSGSAQPQIPAKTLKTFLLPLPPVDEQQEITNRVEKLFTFANQLEERYQAGKDCVDLFTPSLLAKAFRGELVEQDPTDEPASVLLERIRAARAAG
jgi:type I restriction enzyme, S subunit